MFALVKCFCNQNDDKNLFAFNETKYYSSSQINKPQENTHEVKVVFRPTDINPFSANVPI